MKQYDEALVTAFLTSFKPSEVQRTAGISKAKYYKLKADPDFMAVVTERRNMLIKEAVLKMESYLLENVETLQKLIRDPETKGQTKVNALQLFMNQLAGWKGITDLTERIEALEAPERQQKTG